MKRKLMVSLLVFVFMFNSGCSLFNSNPDSSVGQVTGETLLKMAKGALVAVKVLKTTARIVIGTGCQMGQFDAEICVLYGLADGAASVAIPIAEQALAAYQGEPSNITELALNEALNQLWKIWSDFNSLDQATKFTRVLE